MEQNVIKGGNKMNPEKGKWNYTFETAYTDVTFTVSAKNAKEAKVLAIKQLEEEIKNFSEDTGDEDEDGIMSFEKDAIEDALNMLNTNPGFWILRKWKH